MPDSNKNQALDNIKERFALEVSNNYIKKALGKKWREHKSTLKKLYFKKDISLEEKLRNVPPRMLRYQWEDAIRFWNSKKGEEKLKEKKVKYKAIASTDSSVNLRTLITELSIKFWVLKGTVGFDFKDLVLLRPNILDPAPSNTCLPGVKLKLKFRG
ncbi:hypothetical protein PVK06_047487 [Gossypium arboreum]|uniref:Uncharacterized protein n=1 Tax=Gossypium arboreum TaxID=29729 RepID=A0ABR0MDT6_GOSAR|nr:hypothetical protein PVK06_047487 [Gossypium arboreum]